MLLINFFKKASRLFVCKKKSVLMLFLFSRRFHCFLISCLFLNANYAGNSFKKQSIDDIQSRIINANSQLINQNTNFLIFLIVGLTFITVLTHVVIVILKKTKISSIKEIDNLSNTLIEQEDIVFEQNQKILLYTNLFHGLDSRLCQIRSSINNICMDLSSKDKRWTNDLNNLNEFTNEATLSFTSSIAIIEKL